VFATKAQKKKPKQRVSRGMRRCCLTHVGLICDRPDLQPLLPQVVIGNMHTFLACPPNVFLLRQKSAWNNIDTMVHIISLLATVLQPYLGELQPIIFLDACRLHLASRVIAACHAAHIWLIVVPAQMTWLLQPLDTHTFFIYKLRLKEAYQAARAATEDGKLSISTFLPCLCGVIRHVLQGHRWSGAFDEDGFGADSGRCRPWVKRALEIEVPIVVPGWCPTDEQFKLCFPQRAKVSIAALLQPFFVGPVRPPRALPAPRSKLQTALVAGVISGEGRTRGEKRKAEEAEVRGSGAAAPSRLGPHAVIPGGVGPQAVLPRGAPIAFLKGI
jgi:hypothetical protein